MDWTTTATGKLMRSSIFLLTLTIAVDVELFVLVGLFARVARVFRSALRLEQLAMMAISVQLEKLRMAIAIVVVEYLRFATMRTLALKMPATQQQGNVNLFL